MSHFYNYARRAVDPNRALKDRRCALRRCLGVLAQITHFGFTLSPYDFIGGTDWRARHAAYLEAKREYRHGLYARFALKLGISHTLEEMTAEEVVVITNASQVQYHLLRQAQYVLERRRIVQKARGFRQPSRAQDKERRLYWHRVLERFESGLGE